MIKFARQIIGREAYRLRMYREKAKRFLILFCSHPDVRVKAGLLRYRYFSRRDGIRTFEETNDSDVRRKTISYNLTAFENIHIDFTMRRMPRLLNAVMAVESVRLDSRILVIGPRTESDLLILKGAGFFNVEALDLITYSPWVTLGDMHKIPFKDDDFDVVICGWTLPYSNRPQVVMSEILRVTRTDGLVAFGLEHVVFSRSKLADTDGDGPKGIDPDIEGERINSTSDLCSLIGKSLFHVYFNHDAPLKKFSPDQCFEMTGLGSSQVMLVASIVK